jgi:tetratricopeptide (TPR) repeat protein
MTRFFVSYTQADREWAEWIAWQLEDAGHEAILQAWDFPPGSNFVHEMQQATATADRTIAVLSPAYLASEFASADWYAGFRQDPVGAERRLLPVRVRDCNPEGLLGSIVYADFVGRDDQAARAALLAAANGGKRAKPITAPPFPTDAAARNGESPAFPGILPRVWRVPHPRNPTFTGREDLLAQLEFTFNDTGEAGVVHAVQAIHGLGGIGKTQIAIEYAYRHAGAYDAVWWIRAQEESTLAADFASLAQELGLPEAAIQSQATTIEAASQAQEAMIQAVRLWVGRGGQRYLLVFDNADHPSALGPYLPTTGTGHVMITSRNATWPPRVQATAIPVLSPSDAIAFLQTQTGQQGEAATATLAEELGYLPLALAQAAAYISARVLTLEGYLARFRTQRREVLKRGELSDYEATVATTWELAFQGAAEQAPAAADLLNIMAFLAPDAIPLEVLITNAEVLPEPLRETMKDQVALDDAVVALRRYSLVEALDDQTLSVHRLVQAVLQDRLSLDQHRAWAEAAVHVVAAALPDEGHDPQTWPAWERILPHALAVIQHGNDVGLTDLAVARLNGRVGVHLAARGRPEEAHPMLEHALALSEGELGRDHVDQAIGLHHLARILRDVGDLPAALQAVEHALAIDEAAHGREHPETAADLALMGNILRDQGKLEAARGLLEEVRFIRTKVLGPEHSDVATSLNDLGVVFRRQGNNQAARDVLERALRIHERVDGAESREVAIAIGNLGDVLSDQGDLQQARAFLQRSLGLNELLYGPDHPIVATALLKLARILMKQDQTTDARGFLERALAIDEAAYGGGNPAITPDLDSLGNLLQATGRTDEAMELHERALRIRETSLGPNHPQVATSLNNIADILQTEGDLAGARDRFERAIRITQETAGEESRGMATYHRNLANVLAQQGDLVGARNSLQRALPIWRRIGDQERVRETLRSIRSLNERIDSISRRHKQ